MENLKNKITKWFSSIINRTTEIIIQPDKETMNDFDDIKSDNVSGALELNNDAIEPFESIFEPRVESIESMDHYNRVRLQKEKLNDDEIDLLYDIVYITDKILNENNIRYTIEGGTLLGAIRNGGMILHDNDADFDVLESDIDRILNLEKEFAKYNLVIIITPGWGLQISYKDSPDLAPNMWTDGTKSWTSKWPFLDLISIKFDGEKYICGGSVAISDYPDYYLTRDDWEKPFDKIKFGNLDLWVIAGHDNRINYLDRNYKNWDTMIEMVMDHRENVYFDKPIRCAFTEKDKRHNVRSDKPTKLNF